MNSDLIELLQCLRKYKVRYLIIGGHAVSLHSEPRYTKDLDIWVEATVRNSRQLIKALKVFGAPTNSLVEADFAKPGTLFIFGIAPNRVDILNRIKGVRFKKAYSRKIIVKLGSVSVNCISLDDLITIKKLAGRPQDKADVIMLKRTKKLLQKN